MAKYQHCCKGVATYVSCGNKGKEWTGRSVRCWTDNAAVVAVVNTGWCQDRHLLLPKLDIKSAYHMVPVHPNNCHLLCKRDVCSSMKPTSDLAFRCQIAGAANSKADTLSRGKLSLFFSTYTVPLANPTKTTMYHFVS